MMQGPHGGGGIYDRDLDLIDEDTGEEILIRVVYLPA